MADTEFVMDEYRISFNIVNYPRSGKPFCEINIDHRHDLFFEVDRMVKKVIEHNYQKRKQLEEQKEYQKYLELKKKFEEDNK